VHPWEYRDDDLMRPRRGVARKGSWLVAQREHQRRPREERDHWRRETFRVGSVFERQVAGHLDGDRRIRRMAADVSDEEHRVVLARGVRRCERGIDRMKLASITRGTR